MALDQELGMVAHGLIADQRERHRLFQSEAFQDYAWNMLLTLFVAHANGQRLTEAELLHANEVSQAEAHRCLYWLGRDGQVKPRCAGDDVALTAMAITHLRLYLDQAAANTSRSPKERQN